MMVNGASKTAAWPSAGEWSTLRCTAVIEQFATWSDDLSREKLAAERKQQAEAMAKAEERRTGGGTGGNDNNNTGDGDPVTSWNVHEFQPWTSEEKHFASTTMATLRAQSSKAKKSRKAASSDPNIHSVSLNVLAPKVSKLSPEGAAEMARARVAAAAAAEAMRTYSKDEDVLQLQGTSPTDSLDSLSNTAAVIANIGSSVAGGGGIGIDTGGLFFGGSDVLLTERPSAEFDPVPYANSIFRPFEDPRRRRHTLPSYGNNSSTSNLDVPNGDTAKRVMFTSDTKPN